MVQKIAPHMAAPNGAAAAGDSSAADAVGDGDGDERAAREYTVEELRTMKVRELKSLLHAYGVREVEAVEKEDLVEVIIALQNASHSPPPEPEPTEQAGGLPTAPAEKGVEATEAAGEGKGSSAGAGGFPFWFPPSSSGPATTASSSGGAVSGEGEGAGALFEGAHRNESAHEEGVGAMRLGDGSSYEGQWADGKYEGHGTFRGATGSAYEGQFVAGRYEGRGQYRYAGGHVEVSRWSDSKPVGEGAQWSADRRTAWRLRDGEIAGEVSLEEARQIAARVGLPVPGRRL
jgi:hypothetical protein